LETREAGSSQSRKAEISAAVSAAEQADAAGDHARAIDQLAIAARGGDVEALTRLGKRLLVGDRAPRLPKDGAGLLQRAVDTGGAEAAAVLATLFAVGASRQKGLKDALGQLALAAARGWLPAQQQLLVLSGLAGPHDSTQGDSPEHDWAAIAGRVDLAAWQQAPAGTDLNDAPLIRAFPGFVDHAVCRWLVDKASGRLTRALVYEALSRKTTVRDTRTNTAATLNLLETDFVCALVQTRIAACLGLPFRQLEPLSILHYAEGEEITEHYDFVDPQVPNYEQEIAARGQRIVTFLIYLNDDYEGGETQFPELSISHKGRSGDGVFFVNALSDGSADVRTLHAGRPPQRGEKWIVSQFVRNRETF